MTVETSRMVVLLSQVCH